MARSVDAPELVVLGCGRAARSHARVLRRVSPSTRLRFVSRDPDRAARFAAEHRGAGSYASLEEALGSEDVGAVLVRVEEQEIRLLVAHWPTPSHEVIPCLRRMPLDL